MFTIRRRAALVLLVTGVQSVCVLTALTGYAGWLQRRLTAAVTEQVLDDNRAAAAQFAELVREFGFSDLTAGSRDWERLQGVVERTALPNEGFLCIIANHTGNLLCHPEMRSHAGLATVEHGATRVTAASGTAPISELARPGATFAGTGRVDDETHIIGGTPIPELGITVLAHQRQAGVTRAVGTMMQTSLNIGRVVAVGLIALTALSTAFVVWRYENTLAAINDGLEHLVERRTQALTRTQSAVIFGLAKLADSRDEETGLHLQRIQAYVGVLCTHLGALGMSGVGERADLVVRTSALHDIGKVGVPDTVLRKPGPLTEDERRVMQQHTVIGAECLRAVGAQLGDDDFLTTALEIAEGHHERWDGAGYPHRRRGADIPVAARIVALADVYDALTSPRAYKAAWTHERATAEIRKGEGTQFDPLVVAAFERGIDEFRRIATHGPGGHGSLDAAWDDVPRGAGPTSSGPVVTLLRGAGLRGVAEEAAIWWMPQRRRLARTTRRSPVAAGAASAPT